MLITEEEAKKYPWLKPAPSYDIWYGPTEIPEPWKPIVLQLCEELSKYFDEHPEVDRNLYHLDQGKEKFASACWYDSYGPVNEINRIGEWPENSREEIHAIVNKYKKIMDQTCLHCGSNKATVKSKRGWWYLLCDDCWNNIYKNQ